MANNKVVTIGGFKGFLLLILFMLALSGAGVFVIYKTYREQQTIKNYVTTVGIVVDYKEKFDPAEDDEYVNPYFNKNYVYAPVVEYKVGDKYYEVTAKEYTRNPQLEGSVMEVSYDPNNPSRAVLNKTIGGIKDYFVGIIITVSGPAIIVIAIIYDKKMKRDRD